MLLPLIGRNTAIVSTKLMTASLATVRYRQVPACYVISGTLPLSLIHGETQRKI